MSKCGESTKDKNGDDAVALAERFRKRREKVYYVHMETGWEAPDDGEYLSDEYEERYEGEYDYDKVIYWYEQAAAQGNLIALTELSRLYLNGGETFTTAQEVEVDKAKAGYWSRRAAETGDPNAMYSYGVWLLDILPRDVAEAQSWFQKALGAGLEQAIFGVGRCYYIGDDRLPKDVERARSCFEKALELGNPQARAFLKWLDEAGDTSSV